MYNIIFNLFTIKKLIKSIYKKLIKLVPPYYGASIEYYSNHYRFFYPFGSAMNGQTARLESCRRCLTNLSIDAIIETGTFRGVTTEWFSSFSPIPVYSIEINPRYYFFSKKRLRLKQNVNLFLGSSEEVLSKKLKGKLNNKSLFI